MPITKEKLVEIHKGLSDIQMCFATLGLIETIDADKLKSITEVQEIIEKMLEHIKRQK